MSEREPCQVLGCRNSSARSKKLGCQYLCFRCWSQVPRWMKQRRNRVARALERQGEIQTGGEVYDCRSARAGQLMWLAWRSMVGAAVRRSAGI